MRCPAWVLDQHTHLFLPARFVKRVMPSPSQSANLLSGEVHGKWWWQEQSRGSGTEPLEFDQRDQRSQTSFPGPQSAFLDPEAEPIVCSLMEKHQGGRAISSSDWVILWLFAHFPARFGQEPARNLPGKDPHLSGNAWEKQTPGNLSSLPLWAASYLTGSALQWLQSGDRWIGSSGGGESTMRKMSPDDGKH